MLPSISPVHRHSRSRLPASSSVVEDITKLLDIEIHSHQVANTKIQANLPARFVSSSPSAARSLQHSASLPVLSNNNTLLSPTSSTNTLLVNNFNPLSSSSPSFDDGASSSDLITPRTRYDHLSQSIMNIPISPSPFSSQKTLTSSASTTSLPYLSSSTTLENSRLQKVFSLLNTSVKKQQQTDTLTDERKKGHASHLLSEIERIMNYQDEEKQQLRSKCQQSLDDDHDVVELKELPVKQGDSFAAYISRQLGENNTALVTQAAAAAAGSQSSASSSGSSSHHHGGGNAVPLRGTGKIIRDVHMILSYYRSRDVERKALENNVKLRQQAKYEQSRKNGSKILSNKRLVREMSTNHSLLIDKNLTSLKHHELLCLQARQRKHDLDMIEFGNDREKHYEQAQMSNDVLSKQQRLQLAQEEMKKLQWGWLLLTALVPITITIKHQMKHIIRTRIERETQQFIMPQLRRVYVISLLKPLTESRAHALNIITRTLSRWAIKWQWNKRRVQFLKLYHFLVLTRNASLIRHGLQDTSIKHMVNKIAVWWRGILSVIEAQKLIIELKWNKRETYLIKQFEKKQKQLEQNEKSTHDLILEQKQRQLQRNNQHKKSVQKSRSTNTLLSPNHSALARHEEVTNEIQPKKIPKQYKREVITKFLHKRRAHFRLSLRNYLVSHALFVKTHQAELDLLRTRHEMGVKTHAHDTLSHLHPPKKPFLKVLPTYNELDHFILNASKAIILGKLNGSTGSSGSSHSHNPSLTHHMHHNSQHELHSPLHVQVHAPTTITHQT